MKGDRVEVVVDTGGAVQTFEIVASRAGRRIEVTTARGVVEVTEVTRGGTPVRTGRFMASRLIALVEHPAREGDTTVEVVTRRRIGAKEPAGRRGRAEPTPGLFDDAATRATAEPRPSDARRDARSIEVTRRSARTVAAVVLAAGAGSRFGGGKLLAPLEGRPILQHVLDRLAASGLEDVVVVVLGDDAADVEGAIDWRGARRVRNPEPERGLSSSLQVGIGALGADVDAALIVLGDQPRLPPRGHPRAARCRRSTTRARSSSRSTARMPVGTRCSWPAPRSGSSPRRAATAGSARARRRTRNSSSEIPIRVEGGNPDVDTRADLVGLLENAWAARVVANAEQVDRFREVPDGADFYAPVTGLFRADPTAHRRAGPRRAARPRRAGRDVDRYRRRRRPLRAADRPGTRPVGRARHRARRVAGHARRAARAPERARRDRRRGHRDALAADRRDALERFEADVALIAHVGYDIEAIGPFVRAMESVARRLCVAVLMERQPASIADVCWPPVHGEARVVAAGAARVRGAAPSARA